MLQRIQTIWLLLASLVIFGLFIFPYVSYIDLVGLGKKLLVTGEYSAVNNEAVKQNSSLLLTISTIVVALVPFLTIFQFKNRKLQTKLIYVSIVLVILLGVGLYVSANQVLGTISQSIGAVNIGVGFFLLPVSIIFLSMALGGIRKDEKLIKSADRLR